MLNINKILLPVDLPNASQTVIRQAATLARHFKAEIIMLHAVTALSHAAGVPYDGREDPGWNLLAEVTRCGDRNREDSIEKELQGLKITCLLVKDDPARAIVQAAREQTADLIMMPSHGSTFDQFLLGSVTGRVLHRSERPIWTGAHIEESPDREFAIRNVLCAVDLGPRSEQAVRWAADLSAEFDALLTLAHVTAGVEFWGPGGYYVNQKWQDALVRDASRRITELQKRLGIQAEVFIGSGDVPKILSKAASQTNADLLVTGCYPYSGHLRTHGYAIICAVPIPILNV